MTHRYFCHACQAYQDVVMAPTPTCCVCHSQFVEQTPSQEATTPPVDIDNELSQRLSHTTLGEAPCQSPPCTTDSQQEEANTDSDDDIYTDDDDEDYEDVDDSDDYEDEDDDNDEEDEISAFIESHHRHESRHHHHFYDQDEWDYDIDRYYDEILDYNNHASGFYDGMDDIAPQWSSYLGSHLDIEESNHTWENFLRAMFWPNEDQDRPAPATQSDIDQLEKRQLKEGDAGIDTECSICQENFGVDNEIMILPCKHEYHGLCIQRWLQVSATCPMCRCNIISPEESQRRRQQEPQVTSHPNSLGGRTFTFTSADRRHAIGIMVADVSTLPHHHHHHPAYLEDDFDYYDDYDDLEDEYDDEDDEEDDEDEEDQDEWDQVDQQEPISHGRWRHHHHPTYGPMFICPHGHVVPGFNRLRRVSITEITAHSTSQVGEVHQPNPMDEVD